MNEQHTEIYLGNTTLFIDHSTELATLTIFGKEMTFGTKKLKAIYQRIKHWLTF